MRRVLYRLAAGCLRAGRHFCRAKTLQFLPCRQLFDAVYSRQEAMRTAKEGSFKRCISGKGRAFRLRPTIDIAGQMWSRSITMVRSR